MKATLPVLLISAVVCAGPLQAANRQTLAGHVPPAVARFKLQPTGHLAATNVLNLAIGLPLRDPAALDRLLQQLYDPASPNYRQWLTPGQLADAFGATTADYQAVMDWAKANGLTVTVTHPNRLVLDVKGGVTEVERALHLTLRLYQHPAEARTFFAPDTEPSLDLAVPVLTISGLDNYSLPHPHSHIKPLDQGTGISPRSGSGPGGAYRGSDFPDAYVPGTALTGTGQSVGLLQFDGYYASDIATYASQAGLPSIPLTNVPIDGGVGTPGSGNSEVCLDIEMVMSMAPGVSSIYVYEAPNPSPWLDLLSRMQTDNLAKQLSCSWGGGSPDASSENEFKLMAAQGQSFFNATGDSDAFTGAVEFPSDSTNITEVGGTTLTTTGPAGAYVSETVWNWGYDSSCSCYVGSSGGISTYYGLPSYQLGIDMSQNLGSTTMRNVPDVALTADNVYVVYNNGGTGTFGGTSCATPLWAAFTALINQQAVAAGQGTVGFLNPALYTIGRGAGYAADFHDTTAGNNTWPSSPNLFYAVAGYDLCTGWGTPNGTNLINALAGPPVLAPLLVSNSFSLAAESCPNGVVDPGETVTVNFGLKNIGAANTTNLVVTLQAGGGIVSPSGPQAYGVLVAGGTASALPFTFTASGSCGATNTATLQLQDGSANLGTLAFSFRLGQPAASAIFSQNFDGVTAPALPTGWATSTSGAESLWVTTNSSRDTIPNSVFSPDPASVGVNELDSPAIAMPAGPAQLSFRHNYNLETSYDGGVLEIKVGSGAWTDIVTAGGSFVSGGYNYTLSSLYGNPLAGRQAWSGNSGGFVTALVNLPAAASGQSIQLRWRCGSDISISKTGWYVDTVSINGSSYTCCSNASPGITIQPTSQAAVFGSNVSFQVTASGSTPLLYQWRFNGADLGGASNAALTLTNVSATNAGSYAVLVSNSFGSVLSSNALLTVLDPWIVGQPQSQSVTAGGTAAFTVTAAGTLPLSYQWFKGSATLSDGGNISGSHTATLTLSNVQLADTGSYSVMVTNINGSVVSSNATLAGSFPPLLLTQPLSQRVMAAAAAGFTVGVTGSGTPSFQWWKDGTALTNGGKYNGSATASLVVTNVQGSEMGFYSVVVSNTYGQTVSSNALLSVWPLVGWGSNPDVPAGLTNVVAVANGSSHCLVLNADGTVSAWGSNTYGQTNVPGALTGIAAIAGGSRHSVAVSTNGTVTAWGDNTFGQTNVPAGLSNVVAVACGFYHTLALKADGTVAAWGAGSFYSGSPPHYGQSVVPPGLSNVVGVAAGVYHSLALKADGTVVAWGAGTNNTGVLPRVGQAIVPVGLSNVAALAAGNYHSLALKWDGTVVGWGASLGIPAGWSNVVALAGGNNFSLGLRSDGTVLAWGNDNSGQTNVPPGLADVVGIAAGTSGALALENNGQPRFTAQPVSQSVSAGGSTAFAALAVGAPPLSYQWQFNGGNLAEATQAALTLTNTQPANAGPYALVVTNAFGSVTSAWAKLTVLTTAPVLTGPLLSPAEGFSFTLTGAAGSRYAIEASTNLADWISLETNTSPFLFTDTNAVVLPFRFYRAQQQP